MRISDWSSDVCSSDLRVRHQRSAVANIIADVDQLQRIQQAMRFLAPPAHIEGEDRAASAHLPHGQFMLRMTGETGMQYFFYTAFKEFPHGKRILALLLRTQGERFHPLQHDPGIRSEEPTSELQS